MSYILDSMDELKLRPLSDDFVKHLMGVEDLLQKLDRGCAAQPRSLDDEIADGYLSCDATPDRTRATYRRSSRT